MTKIGPSVPNVRQTWEPFVVWTVMGWMSCVATAFAEVIGEMVFIESRYVSMHLALHKILTPGPRNGISS